MRWLRLYSTFISQLCHSTVAIQCTCSGAGPGRLRFRTSWGLGWNPSSENAVFLCNAILALSPNHWSMVFSLQQKSEERYDIPISKFVFLKRKFIKLLSARLHIAIPKQLLTCHYIEYAIHLAASLFRQRAELFSTSNALNDTVAETLTTGKHTCLLSMCPVQFQADTISPLLTHLPPRPSYPNTEVHLKNIKVKHVVTISRILHITVTCWYLRNRHTIR